MNRNEIVKTCDHEVLDKATRLFGTKKGNLKVFDSYEGCANLVYEYEREGKPFILRVSFRPDRTAAQIQAELHYVNYLAEGGVRISEPLRSRDGNLVETIHAGGKPFHVVSFVKGKGIRVPDNDYRYREDAPIEEYFQNWGRVLGQMHALSKKYRPSNEWGKRPDWFALHQPAAGLEERLADRLPLVYEKIIALFDELKALPRDEDSYGLIHGDFNDGNFTVDYTNGDITVFDFDDCSYFWFVYELASAWEGGIGRIMFRGLKERKIFMELYMAQVMEGYQKENKLTAKWMGRLPLFLRLIQVEEFLYFSQYLDREDPEMQAGLRYKIKCIEEDIPYMGFFDSIFSPERPFSL